MAGLSLRESSDWHLRGRKNDFIAIQSAKLLEIMQLNSGGHSL